MVCIEMEYWTLTIEWGEKEEGLAFDSPMASGGEIKKIEGSKKKGNYLERMNSKLAYRARRTERRPCENTCRDSAG